LGPEEKKRGAKNISPKGGKGAKKDAHSNVCQTKTRREREKGVF